VRQTRRAGPRHLQRRSAPEWVHQFLITLINTDPLVWRRIQVPEDYFFWDLHVAIQDAMGWLDCHLHEFRVVVDSKRGRVERFGIPGDEFLDERPCRPDWTIAVSQYVVHGGLPISYVYDFGDDWHHVVSYEGAVPFDPSGAYPRCVSGAQRCPPEDCGGVHGYSAFLEAIRDPKHPEHSSLLQWAGGRFDPGEFDPTQIVFDDPKKRWEKAFAGSRQ
jgi:pRiA4b ORF-3-like protein